MVNSDSNIYRYSLINGNSITVFVPEEYFYPYFNETIEYIEKQFFYRNIRNIYLDFRHCKLLHSIGMSLETQLYFEKAKSNYKSVYWIGNKEMYSIIEELSKGEISTSDIMPYYSTIEEIDI